MNWEKDNKDTVSFASYCTLIASALGRTKLRRFDHSLCKLDYDAGLTIGACLAQRYNKE